MTDEELEELVEVAKVLTGERLQALRLAVRMCMVAETVAVTHELVEVCLANSVPLGDDDDVDDSPTALETPWAKATKREPN